MFWVYRYLQTSRRMHANVHVSLQRVGPKARVIYSEHCISELVYQIHQQNPCHQNIGVRCVDIYYHLAELLCIVSFAHTWGPILDIFYSDATWRLRIFWCPGQCCHCLLSTSAGLSGLPDNFLEKGQRWVHWLHCTQHAIIVLME